MDYPKTMVKTHVRFHEMVAGTPFEGYWHLDNAGEYLQLDFKRFMAYYGARSDGERAFSRFLISVWDKHHEGTEIDQFWLRDIRDLDERYAHTVAQWAADPFWA